MHSSPAKMKTQIETLQRLAFAKGNLAAQAEVSASFATEKETTFRKPKSVLLADAAAFRAEASAAFSEANRLQFELEDQEASSRIFEVYELSPEACKAIAELHLCAPEKAARKEEVKALDGTRYQLPRRA
jgi:hypothetical protein